MPTRRQKPKPNGRIVSAREAQALELRKSLERAMGTERTIQQRTRQLRWLVSRSDEQLEELEAMLGKRSQALADSVASAEGRTQG